MSSSKLQSMIAACYESSLEYGQRKGLEELRGEDTCKVCLRAYQHETQSSRRGECSLERNGQHGDGYRTAVVADVIHGEQVCQRCGLVMKEYRMVDTCFGKGMGQYSSHSTRDSHKLDRACKTRQNENGQTRVFYKTMIKAQVGQEIDGLVDETHVAELAKVMFARYTDKMESIRGLKSIVDACVRAARNHYIWKSTQGREMKTFKCKVCLLEFNCKKDRRYHTCCKNSNQVKPARVAETKRVSSPTPTLSLEHPHAPMSSKDPAKNELNFGNASSTEKRKRFRSLLRKRRGLGLAAKPKAKKARKK